MWGHYLTGRAWEESFWYVGFDLYVDGKLCYIVSTFVKTLNGNLRLVHFCEQENFTSTVKIFNFSDSYAGIFRVEIYWSSNYSERQYNSDNLMDG